MTSTALHTTNRGARRIFTLCHASRNPGLAFSRACSKVGWLARSEGRSSLHLLCSALNEQKHAIMFERLGRADDQRRHEAARNQDLRAFERALQALDDAREAALRVNLQQLAAVDVEECEDNDCCGCAWCDAVAQEDEEARSRIAAIVFGEMGQLAKRA